ncbi:MAG: PAS domain-containing sensor histidine kinase [Planctomycetota bacterium]|nr:MAG: PAS domain-containing sensor histidine kinase [Planctomycetota bacterium]
MPVLMRSKDVLILVAGAVVLALLLCVRAVDGAAHVEVVSAFQGMQAQEARRDDELLSLRYGLSMNYDGLRAIEGELLALRAKLGAAPRLVHADADSELVGALAALDADLSERARRIEDFVSGSAMLNNALRGLPKVVEQVGASDLAAHVTLAADLERLVGHAFRCSLSGEQHVRAEAGALVEQLRAVAPQLDAAVRDKVQTALFLAETVVAGQESVDSELRTLLEIDAVGRIDAAARAYLDAHARIDERVRDTRWVLFASCLALLAYALHKHLDVRRLNASIERKVVERTAELAASREQYRALVETTQAIPWQWDDETRRFTYVGPQAVALLGFPSSAWLEPAFWEQRGHPEDRAAVRQRWEMLRETGRDVELEFRMRRADGAWVWLRSIVSSARVGGNPAHLQGFMLDITERRRIEFELQQAQKLESVGRLASGVAHEINTPVQFVSDSVHFLRDAAQDLFGLLEKQRALSQAVAEGRAADELAEVARAVALAEQAADVEYLVDNVPKAFERSLDGLDRVATIVRSMKAFAHPDQSEMTLVDINKAIESTLVIARNEYKYVADVRTEFGDIPLVTCHGGDINQAVLNIVVNAAHAIGDVVQGTDCRGLIRVLTRCDGECVEIAISDTGAGIPEDVRARIFDPFFTTKPLGKGTGQGLAIARSVVVDKHKGEIRVDTEAGKGTTFTLRVPVHPPVAAKLAA